MRWGSSVYGEPFSITPAGQAPGRQSEYARCRGPLRAVRQEKPAAGEILKMETCFGNVFVKTKREYKIYDYAILIALGNH